MNIFGFYVTLRKEILEVITGTDDAEGSLFWDDTTPNWITKKKLESIFKRNFEIISKKLGVYIVTRHFPNDCENEAKHGDGFPETNKYGLEITPDKYTWTNYHPRDEDDFCKCPCDLNNRLSYHRVMDTIVYESSREHNFDIEELLGILGDILIAIDCSEDRRPRSAIRENLLCAVIRINDQLLPQSMEEYIKQNSIKSAQA
ncbi:hypothetical protein ACQKP8_27205 [Photobacterium alginatilyticum]|uniref:hypothetical protein n=1 Tax=Photobacterium alginatilyticum TaxID=1775171 RepID=UPI004068613E